MLKVSNDDDNDDEDNDDDDDNNDDDGDGGDMGITNVLSILIIKEVSRSCLWHVFIKLNFQGFQNRPYVFVTPLHTLVDRGYDAAIIWVENISSVGFQICLRELKNFDGLHSSIRVVSVKPFFFTYYILHEY